MTNVVSKQPKRPTEGARPSAHVAHGTGEARPWHNPRHPMKSGENLGPYRLLRERSARVEWARSIVRTTRGCSARSPSRFSHHASRRRTASSASSRKRVPHRSLNHPNILTIHDVGRQGDTAYFAMEWVEGRTLRDELRAGPIPHRRTIQLAQQIAEGLAAAHAAGIIHRDLKPENVMVDRTAWRRSSTSDWPN